LTIVSLLCPTMNTIYYLDNDWGNRYGTTFHCHRKSMVIWIGTNNLVFCSGYDAPTLFPSLQYRSFACRERNTLYTRYPLWSMVRLAPIYHRGTHWIALPYFSCGSEKLFHIICLYHWTCSHSEYSWNTAHWTLSNYQSFNVIGIGNYMLVQSWLLFHYYVLGTLSTHVTHCGLWSG
jgi:hypothetical protein